MTIARTFTAQDYLGLKTATRLLNKAVGGLEAAESLSRGDHSTHGRYQSPNTDLFIPVDVVVDLEHAAEVPFVTLALPAALPGFGEVHAVAAGGAAPRLIPGGPARIAGGEGVVGHRLSGLGRRAAHDAGLLDRGVGRRRLGGTAGGLLRHGIVLKVGLTGIGLGRALRPAQTLSTVQGPGV